MPIRPIDMQVAIPKLSEISRTSHLENQKSGLQQQQNATKAEQSVNRENRTVVQSEQGQKSSSDADARQKGRNEYTNLRRNRKQEEVGKADKKPPKSQNRIDIRI